MAARLSRRELLAATLAVPTAAPAWDEPVPLGRSGLKVTPLGMGCEVTRDPKLIRKAADRGITYFNSMPWQKKTDHLPVTGEALKPVRAQVVLSCGSAQRTGKAMLDDLDSQLRAFGTDYIDLYYLIAASNSEHLSDDMLEGLRAARQAGKIRACGVTTHRLDAILPRLIEAGMFGAVMIPFNFALADPRPTLFGEVIGGVARVDSIARLRKAGLGIVAMKPMMGGLSQSLVPPERRAWADSLDSDAKRRAALSAALKWVVRSEHVDTAPVQMPGLEELEANLNAAAAAFTEADRSVLEAEVSRISQWYCRMCNRCDGACSQGLPVADVMRFLMYAEGYGDIPRARAEFARLRPGLREVRCETCAGCTVHCPNSVRVKEQLGRAQNVLA